MSKAIEKIDAKIDMATASVSELEKTYVDLDAKAKEAKNNLVNGLIKLEALNESKRILNEVGELDG